ncbi:Clp protease ClpP [Clostridiales Family XIII bacterium ASD5510]|uniref:ATP-dependent Clp protease proteolytic subunit n=1 Tax=Hominibacterium faecale TaxID=2839743 RepID=A0A9J6QQI0_9FIRM|nr:head maturation protease, ClpP-related [Hominibacterium faecale]MCU7378133.1 Clp protease ClpP [Hominibacterium faecale]
MTIGSKMPKNSRKTGKNMPVKAYNMAILDDDSAEINMYGDVLMEAPRDYWTGERINGMYIAADEFLEDLEQIKDKSNITVYINSGGGDLYAGLAIYNRLKELNGHITTVNDGLAASAASLIFQAGDTRKMNKASNIMAHGVAGFLFGYYNLNDLNNMVKQFEAGNEAVVNVYAERMGVTYEEAQDFINGETWKTGQAAVDIGLADEVIETEEEDAEGLLDSLINKVSSVYGRQNSAVPAGVPQVANIKKDGGKKVKTTDELREAYPELVAQIEQEAADKGKMEGRKAERERIKGIEDIAGGVLDKALLNDAKFGEQPMSAAELSLSVMRQQASIGADMLNALEKDAKNSGADNVKSNPKNAEDDDPDKEDEEEKENEIKDLVNIVNGTKKGAF